MVPKVRTRTSPPIATPNPIPILEPWLRREFPVGATVGLSLRTGDVLEGTDGVADGDADGDNVPERLDVLRSLLYIAMTARINNVKSPATSKVESRGTAL